MPNVDPEAERNAILESQNKKVAAVVDGKEKKLTPEQQAKVDELTQAIADNQKQIEAILAGESTGEPTDGAATLESAPAGEPTTQNPDNTAPSGEGTTEEPAPSKDDGEVPPVDEEAQYAKKIKGTRPKQVASFADYFKRPKM